ncbi:hypothetical protein K402DRAFT_328966 [Aulographum hederae CBS 113979]|uniref:Swiss Army Knife RNA repair protein HAD domain-containing protein n=1 Tax=Aulographum hederae CBS 113979 TaxID=1176131 RepID=A0A6G1H555_9PEZI|nr:hypothetical protein K402DRAFT_328966 [Aulographum hederae CBS 113979]
MAAFHNPASANSKHSYTTTALKRWSCQEGELPATSTIKVLHIYDFDNTLFQSPLPNKQLWDATTIGRLQGEDIFAGGGWWHNKAILESTGDGLEKEEPRAWEGWWNEQIVSLVEMSMEDPEALCVLLTGRAEGTFGDLIKRMVKSKGLKFDMVCLKPKVGPLGQKFASTAKFKQALLDDIMWTYTAAEDIRIYEDRPSHVKGFNEYLARFNTLQKRARAPVRRPEITFAVVPVAENAGCLDPVTEVAEIQRMINDHNMLFRSGISGHSVPYQLNSFVEYTAYMIDPHTAGSLRALGHIPQSQRSSVNLKGDEIMICHRRADRDILGKVGGIGNKTQWRVTATGSLDNRVWAARVVPDPPSQRVQTLDNSDNRIVILALRSGLSRDDARMITNWQPVNEDIVFQSTVGEKDRISLVREPRPKGHNAPAHKRQRSEEFPPLGAMVPPNMRHGDAPQGQGNSHQASYTSRHNRDGFGGRGKGAGPRGGRGGDRGRGNNSRGGGGGGNHGQNSGRGGQQGYKSLDDVGGSGGYPAHTNNGYGGNGHKSGASGSFPYNY